MTNRSPRCCTAIALWFVFALLPSEIGLSQVSEDWAESDVTYLGLLKGVKHGAVVYSQGADYKLKCDVYIPEGKGPFPAVLAVHGGAWRSGSKINLLRHSITFCNHGFVVVCINYRHAPKYPFPAQIQDCFTALRFMVDNAEKFQIDPDQLFGFGYSAGGHLISLMATTSEGDWDGDTVGPSSPAIKAKFKAVAVGGAPCDFDWLSEDSTSLAFWLQAGKAEDPEAYSRAAPITHVTPETPPFFMYHGVDDQIVPLACLDRFQQRLSSQGVACEAEKIEGCGHIETFMKLEMIDRAAAFYRRHLPDQGQTSQDSATPRRR